MNTKYVSSSMLKTSKFSRVHSTSENSDVINSREKVNFLFILYFDKLHEMSYPLKREARY